MATGGDTFAFENKGLDDKIDNDDEQEVKRNDDANTTQTFEPTRTSTSYFDWSKLEMQPMQEQSGLPDTSYEETPLLTGSNRDADIERRLAALRHDPITGIINTTHMMDTSINPLSQEDRAKQIEIVKKLIKDKYPNANFKNLPIAFSKKSPMDIVALGPKGGETKIVLNDGRGLQQSFLNLTYVKKALGPTAQQIIEEERYQPIEEDRDTVQEQLIRFEESKKQLEEAEKIAAEKKKEAQKIQDVQDKIERNNAKIAAIHEQEGSNLESETELRRLQQLNKNYETELKGSEKLLATLEKKQKATEKANREKLDRERKKLSDKKRKSAAIQERLHKSEQLNELHEDEARLKKQNEDDQAIIDDPSSAESVKEEARVRQESRNAELARIQAQVAEREDSMPLRERVREIFKKYGVTVTAIFLAAGVTIGAVVGAITNALKSMGNQLANGLKDVGAKAASALPGLIGAMVNFLFKKAGEAVGFLAEHTWLIILAAVVFIFEKYIKNRR